MEGKHIIIQKNFHYQKNVQPVILQLVMSELVMLGLYLSKVYIVKNMT